MKTSRLLQSKWNTKGFTLILQETRRVHDSMIRNQVGFTLTWQETWSIHDSMIIPKIEFIAYIYILL